MKLRVGRSIITVAITGWPYMIPYAEEFKPFITAIESHTGLYTVIHKSLPDFRTRLRNNQDRHGRKEHINR